MKARVRPSLSLILGSLVLTACSAGGDVSAVSEDELAGATPTEIKVQLDAAQLGVAISRLGLSEHGGEAREVTFYDTSDLALLDDGIVLRTRRVLGGPDDDATVKLRPLSAKSVDRAFFDESGFKCELDKNVGKPATSSCSLTEPEPEKDILAVRAGDDGAKSLFSTTQERFLSAHHKGVPWSRLVVLGPIAARVWKLEPKGWKTELTIERWIVPGGATSIEVSLKTRWSDRASEERRLLDFLSGRGLAPAAQQDTKTRAALLALTDR
jgi:hypothetical protein